MLSFDCPIEVGTYLVMEIRTENQKENQMEAGINQGVNPSFYFIFHLIVQVFSSIESTPTLF